MYWVVHWVASKAGKSVVKKAEMMAERMVGHLAVWLDARKADH